MNHQPEIYQDISKNCDILLEGILKPFEQTDDTPEGRMITQLKWLKERAENQDLPLPVAPADLSTLRYVYTEGELCRHASSPDKAREEIEIYLSRLLGLTREAELLVKPAYYPYIIRMLNALLDLLQDAPRELSEYEQGLIGELEKLKYLLNEGQIEPPLMSYLPDYPNYMEVNSFVKVSIDDLPNGKTLCKTVANLIFEGIRPDSWLTPEEAERLTKTTPP